MRPNPQETADLVAFTEEILNEKLHFLCSEQASKHALKNIELIAIEISIVKPSIMSSVFVTRENIRT